MKNKFRSGEAIAYCLLSIACCLIITSCNSDDDYVPKPRAYMRITFPEKKYVVYSAECPYKFNIPVYSTMAKDTVYNALPCWLNLNFPSFNGTLHITYVPLEGNINKYMEDTYELATKHQIKASAIEQQQISKPANHVYGLAYDIEGNAASPFQFFLTDSTKHFLRGALYFNAAPNIDSIGPVVEFIKKDIFEMIESFEWKNANTSGTLPQTVHKK